MFEFKSKRSRNINFRGRFYRLERTGSLVETRILKKWDPILKKDELESQSGVVRRICQWQFSAVWVQSERNWKRKIKSCAVWKCARNSKLKVEVRFRVELWYPWWETDLDNGWTPMKILNNYHRWWLSARWPVKGIIHYSFLKRGDRSALIDRPILLRDNALHCSTKISSNRDMKF